MLHMEKRKYEFVYESLHMFPESDIIIYSAMVYDLYTMAILRLEHDKG